MLLMKHVTGKDMYSNIVFEIKLRIGLKIENLTLNVRGPS